jgi:Tfp pilus assembly protein PilN
LGLPVQPLEIPGLAPDPQFVEAVGIAIGDLDRGVATIDLVREEFEQARKKRRDAMKMRLVALAGAVILVGAVFFGATTLQKQREIARRIQGVQTRVNEANAEAQSAQKEYELLATQAKLLETALQPEHPWLDVLQDVSDRAPKGIWLSGLDLEKGKNLSLRGTGLDQANVQSFWTNLSRSPMLVRPNLSYSNQALIGDRTVFQFGITSDIRGNEPKPTKPAKKKTPLRSAKTAADASEPGGSTEKGQ